MCFRRYVYKKKMLFSLITNSILFIAKMCKINISKPKKKNVKMPLKTLQNAISKFLISPHPSPLDQKYAPLSLMRHFAWLFFGNTNTLLYDVFTFRSNNTLLFFKLELTKKRKQFTCLSVVRKHLPTGKFIKSSELS